MRPGAGVPARTRVKICGVTSASSAAVAAESGADAIGFVLAPDSPRTIDRESAIEIARRIPPWIAPVAVFVDASEEEILAWPFPWVQLHGTQRPTPEVLRRRRVIRAIAYRSEADHDGLLEWDRLPGVAALLVDAPRPGSGSSFDHESLALLRPALQRPLLVAGGLDAENVGAAIERLRPWAVDVSSGVERAPGVKDDELVRDFCRAVASVS